jgi:hypothetical protein
MEDKRMTGEAALEQRIGEWRTYFGKRQAVQSADVAELEDHLRSSIDALRTAGLDDDEAFLVAVKRLGALDSVSREFAREYTERMWKRLVVEPAEGEASPIGRDAKLAIGLAIAAAIAMKVPELFGKYMHGSAADNHFYAHNVPFFILPFLAIFFAVKRSLSARGWLLLGIPFVLGAVLTNALPFVPDGNTEALAIIHVPIALWFAIVVAYTGGQWRNLDQRMNYVRFSGEWFIYLALTALGGGALIAFTFFIFEAIGLKPAPVVERFIGPCGVAGAVIIAAWLVEFKQSVIENMAPVLTMLFTPLFTLLLLVFIGAMIATGNAINVQREVLIGFDLLLVLVLCLLLYSISARDSNAAPGKFDTLRLVLVCAALVVDVLALWAIVARISEFGWSPNKTAALGVNILLLVNLGWSAVLYTRILARKAPFVTLERWQTMYLPAFAAWAWIVIAIFPVIFKYQ